MLYHLLTPLSEGGDLFNLFRYITFRAGGAFFTALVFGFFLGRPIIDWLRRLQKKGQPIRGDSFLVLINADAEQVKFTLPREAYGRRWQLVVDTADPDDRRTGPHASAAGRVVVTGRSIQVLRRMDDARDR